MYFSDLLSIPNYLLLDQRATFSTNAGVSEGGRKHPNLPPPPPTHSPPDPHQTSDAKAIPHQLPYANLEL